jgi:ribosomal protein L20
MVFKFGFWWLEKEKVSFRSLWAFRINLSYKKEEK